MEFNLTRILFSISLGIYCGLGAIPLLAQPQQSAEESRKPQWLSITTDPACPFDIDKGEKIRVTLRLQNRSNEDLVVLAVEPCCQCSLDESATFPQTIAPGAAIQVPIEYQQTTFGAAAKRVRIRTSMGVVIHRILSVKARDDCVLPSLVRTDCGSFQIDWNWARKKGSSLSRYHVASIEYDRSLFRVETSPETKADRSSKYNGISVEYDNFVTRYNFTAVDDSKTNIRSAARFIVGDDSHDRLHMHFVHVEVIRKDLPVRAEPYFVALGVILNNHTTTPISRQIKLIVKPNVSIERCRIAGTETADEKHAAHFTAELSEKKGSLGIDFAFSLDRNPVAGKIGKLSIRRNIEVDYTVNGKPDVLRIPVAGTVARR